jgi:transcription elongation factor Elf1
MPHLTVKFYCSTCRHRTVSRVLETRGQRRRRECAECGNTFATLERLAPIGRKPKRYPNRFVPLPFDDGR